MSRIATHGLSVAAPLHAFIVEEALPGSGVEADTFFAGLAAILADLAPRNAAMLARRGELQAAIDAWHERYPGRPDPAAYRAFLVSIGYLVDAPSSVSVCALHVDDEIAGIAGPQLVVPVDNARYALNAANARWGSLYDALYGSDAISDADGGEITQRYNEVRGARVIARAMQLLDESAPLVQGSWGDASALRIEDGALLAELVAGSHIGLKRVEALVGYTGRAAAPTSILLRHHGLHLEVVIDRDHPVGRQSGAGIKDLVLEAALSTIQDCEDSVAAVDVEDKVDVYRNWLGLMKGTLEERFEKRGQQVVRRLAPDRRYTAPEGGELSLPGRGVLLVRHVGSHVISDAVLDADGQAVPETYIDALVTSLCAMHDLAKGDEEPRNSRTGSVYIVKPKQHGPDEVALSCELFSRVEHVLGIPAGTLKIGLMDEERRTSANLTACIGAAADRLILINTGFLDRTGDEIHTSMHAGAMVPKSEMTDAAWLTAYEDNNVNTGLACGLGGRAQIGKGMWAMPDAMADMLATKQTHPESGASTAWVPSPTAAVLHALHYHAVDVAARQAELAGRAPASQDALLTLPLLEPGRQVSADAIERELDNNLQSMLGYVVRWVQQGVGCSKVADIDDVALMEDRATLRISSQFLANWLHHELIGESDLRDGMERMALLVDRQNAGDPDYVPMAPDFDASQAFLAVMELVLKGRSQPNGYTEFVLTERRQLHKLG